MTRRMLIAALAFAGVFLAIYLTLYKLGAIGQLACSVGDCETVNLSRWSRFLGMPVAAWGASFYVVVFAVALAGTTDRFAGAPWVSTSLLALTSCGRGLVHGPARSDDEPAGADASALADADIGDTAHSDGEATADTGDGGEPAPSGTRGRIG